MVGQESLLTVVFSDSVEISKIEMSVSKPWHTHPLKSIKRGEGQKQTPHYVLLVFSFNPGDYIYADEDGIGCFVITALV